MLRIDHDCLRSGLDGAFEDRQVAETEPGQVDATAAFEQCAKARFRHLEHRSATWMFSMGPQ
jgi:hypothetical protein